MKKFVNNVDDILTESLTGFGNAHNDILEVNLSAYSDSGVSGLNSFFIPQSL